MVFCSVIVVSQLVRLSNVLVTFGLTLENILLPFLYIIVPFLPVIIPISFLFGVMIAFSRLSHDGELTALMAAGMSPGRACLPLALLTVLLYGVTTQCAVHLEAWGRREFVQFIYRKTQTEIDNMIRFKIQPGVFLKDFLDYVFYTEVISPDRNHYNNVMLAPQQRSEGAGNFIVMSPEAEISGSVAGGDLRMILFNGVSYSYNHEDDRAVTLNFARAEIDILRVFQEKILGEDNAKDDYRSYTAAELRNYVQQRQNKPEQNKDYLKAAYLYYSRFANGFVLFALACFGMVLGIHEQRHSKNRAYLNSVLTIMACFVTMVGFRWIAEQGIIPVLPAIWLPQLMLFLLGAFCLIQRSRLPLSEPIFALRNLPFRGIFRKKQTGSRARPPQ